MHTTTSYKNLLNPTQISKMPHTHPVVTQCQTLFDFVRGKDLSQIPKSEFVTLYRRCIETVGRLDFRNMMRHSCNMTLTNMLNIVMNGNKTLHSHQKRVIREYYNALFLANLLTEEHANIMDFSKCFDVGICLLHIKIDNQILKQATSCAKKFLKQKKTKNEEKKEEEQVHKLMAEGAMLAIARAYAITDD